FCRRGLSKYAYHRLLYLGIVTAGVSNFRLRHDGVPR
ncbi:Uncharacterized protein APZ42_007974, partial [Daphnia magna]